FLTLIFILFIFEIDLWRVISFEMVLIILSLIIFVEFYYYWKYPELFQYMRATDGPDLRQGIWRKGEQKSFFSGKDRLVKHVSPGLPQEIVSDLKRKVLIQMLENKVFKNPGLNIAMLSEMIETKPHILSKLLNEEFNKSFRDFINEYRINEFIKLASAEKYKNYTLLALSYEVGFNSKSTFNLAFKKEMGISPSNYLKNNKINLRN
ncbi:MAG: helix-turn-helix domain-containing protein, partial [Bacteroidales bacterium]|nr:helix-turn-helix domain-containing protein [Bacteroidales bacterium]